MTSLRRQVLNEAHSQSGSIVEEMKSYALQATPNDGIGIYGNIRINPITSAPFTNSQEIQIPITSSNFDVMEFSNTYLHILARLRIRVSNPPVIEGDDAFSKMLKENQFVMLGLKCGNHVLRDYAVKFNNIPIPTTTQSSAVYEHFLYSTFKSTPEISNKKYVYSPYEEVHEYNNSICGVYIPIGDFASGTFYKELDIIIPIREIVAFQSFNEFPTRIFGSLELVFHTTADAFVYTETNPITSIRKNIISGKIDKSVPHLSEVLACVGETFDYTHAFEQIGIASPIQFISGWDEENNRLKFSTIAEFTPYIDELVVSECWVDAKGYRATDAAIRELTSFFSINPFVVPSQRVETHVFPAGPEPNGLRTSMSIQFNHTTDITLLHPTDSRQRTIFRNIEADHYQVQIGTRRIPDQLISTLSPEFYEQQIQNSDFDSIFEANESWERSLTEPQSDGEKFLKPTTDNTSFCPNFNVERNGSNGNSLWFDGINSYEKVEITSVPLHPQKDPYYKGASSPSPILCLTSDTAWVFRLVNGKPSVQYLISNTLESGLKDPSMEAVSR